MIREQRQAGHRFETDAGIAIGPILFIIAILAILAAAIAAGSGSFTSGTSSESNRTKASALIQIGENLRVGMDRLILEGDVNLSSVIISPNNTSNNVDLFSPSGGGITVPSVSMSNDPTNDVWFYPQGAIPALGTNNAEQLAVIQVGQGVCTEINSRANSINTPAGADLGNFASNNDITASTLNSWPNTLAGKPIGCVNNTNGSGGFYFYEVLAIQ